MGAELEADGAVTIENVPACCHARDVAVDVPGLGPRRRATSPRAATGSSSPSCPALPLELANAAALTDATLAILRPCARRASPGRDGAEIDHVELFGPPRAPDADARNFVLCPGGAYDRSPCGTGTSAKMAVLAARGKLAPGPALAAGEHHRQALRGLARGAGRRARPAHPGPRVRHRAGDALLRPRDPFREGFTGGSDERVVPSVIVVGAGIVGRGVRRGARRGRAAA